MDTKQGDKLKVESDNCKKIIDTFEEKKSRLSEEIDVLLGSIQELKEIKQLEIDRLLEEPEPEVIPYSDEDLVPNPKL